MRREGAAIGAGRNAEPCLERAGEMRLVGEAHQQRRFGRKRAALQQRACASHPHVDQIGMRRQADLGAEDANR